MSSWESLWLPHAKSLQISLPHSLYLRYSSMPLENCSAKRKPRGNHVHTCEDMCSCVCTKQRGHQSFFKHHVSLFYYYFLDCLSLAWNLPSRQGWVASPSPVSAGIINTPHVCILCVRVFPCMYVCTGMPGTHKVQKRASASVEPDDCEALYGG